MIINCIILFKRLLTLNSENIIIIAINIAIFDFCLLENAHEQTLFRGY